MLQDLRYAWRGLTRAPGFTALAVAALALGIGANTGIFTLVSAVLLRPLPYPQSERLVAVWSRQLRPKSQASMAYFMKDVSSYPQYLEWKRRNHVFEGMAANSGGSVNLTGADHPERLYGLRVTPDYFSVLGVQPQIGRSFLPEEEIDGKHRVTILTAGLWERQFGRDPAIVGKTIYLNGERYQVIGVLPRGIPYASDAELFVPLLPESNPQHGYLRVTARLKPDASLDQARAEMEVIAAALRKEDPKAYQDVGVNILSLQEDLAGDVKPALLILMGAVSFVLLIACVNVANMLLARGVGRARDLAVRAALGAGRARLIRQVLAETFVLAGLGGAAGILLGAWTVALILATVPQDYLPPMTQTIQTDWRVTAFALAATFFSALAAGWIPAWQGSRVNVQVTLKAGSRGSGMPAHAGRVRALLVAAQVSFSVVLLVGSVLLARSLVKLLAVNPGFSTEKVLTFRSYLPEAKYRSRRDFGNPALDLVTRLERVPGVSAAGVITTLPISGGQDSLSFEIQDQPLPRGKYRSAGYQEISPRYFAAMGIPLKAGREFTNRDAAEATIVNETMARRFWGVRSPLGQHIRLSRRPWMEVVGVVADVHHNGVDRDPRPEIYVPIREITGSFYFVLRSDRPLGGLATDLRRAVTDLDKDLPLDRIATMNAVLRSSLSARRFQTGLLSSLGVLALLLAAVGIYGVVSFTVGQRTQEIGVRMALGAQARDVVKLVVGQGMRPVFLGVVAGLAGALALSRFLQDQLYGIAPTDATTFALAAVLLLLVALLAGYLPARRAAKIDPMSALRFE